MAQRRTNGGDAPPSESSSGTAHRTHIQPPPVKWGLRIPEGCNITFEDRSKVPASPVVSIPKFRTGDKLYFSIAGFDFIASIQRGPPISTAANYGNDVLSAIRQAPEPTYKLSSNVYERGPALTDTMTPATFTHVNGQDVLGPSRNPQHQHQRTRRSPSAPEEAYPTPSTLHTHRSPSPSDISPDWEKIELPANPEKETAEYKGIKPGSIRRIEIGDIHMHFPEGEWEFRKRRTIVHEDTVGELAGSSQKVIEGDKRTSPMNRPGALSSPPSSGRRIRRISAQIFEAPPRLLDDIHSPERPIPSQQKAVTVTDSETEHIRDQRVLNNARSPTPASASRGRSPKPPELPPLSSVSKIDNGKLVPNSFTAKEKGKGRAPNSNGHSSHVEISASQPVRSRRHTSRH